MAGSRVWLTWKFGGTSVASADHIVNVASLIWSASAAAGVKTAPVAAHVEGFSASAEKSNRETHQQANSLDGTSTTNFSGLGSSPTSPKVAVAEQTMGLLSHRLLADNEQSVYGSDFDLALPDKEYTLAVVVSAMAGVTNALQACCDAATDVFHRSKCSSNYYRYYHRHLSRPSEMKDDKLNATPCMHSHHEMLQDVQKQHFACLDRLLSRNLFSHADAEVFRRKMEIEVGVITDVLRALSVSGSLPTSLKEVVMGSGELWSSRLLFGVLRKMFEGHLALPADKTGLSVPPPPSTNSLSNSAEAVSCSHVAGACLSQDEAPNFCESPSICPFCPPDMLPTASGGSPCVSSSVVGWIDARQVLVVKPSPSSAESSGHDDADPNERVHFCWDTSRPLMDKWLVQHPCCRVIVITGYICSTTTGIPSTLKRNGSDYSGSLFAALLQSRLYTVWTDVDGVYTADPRKVPEAHRLPYLSYTEAIELAYFGAKVLHPLTMEPCIKSNIPIVLRSSLRPDSPGTLIWSHLPDSPAPSHFMTPATSSRYPSNSVSPRGAFRRDASIKALTRLDSNDTKDMQCNHCRAFTLIDNISLVSVEGTSMLGVPGGVSRLFTAMHQAGCSVVMISQASSGHSVCLAVLSFHAEKAAEAIESAFYKEICHDKSMKVSTTDGCTIICAVGEGMCGSLGVLGRLATALADADVNVKAVSQGSSEVNITFVVATKDAIMAIRAMHAAIYSPQSRGETELAGEIQSGSAFHLKATQLLPCNDAGVSKSLNLTQPHPHSEAAPQSGLDLELPLDSSLSWPITFNAKSPPAATTTTAASSGRASGRHLRKQRDGSSDSDESIIVLILVPYLPLQPVAERAIKRTIRDSLGEGSTGRLFLVKGELPLVVGGFTDGLHFVKSPLGAIAPSPLPPIAASNLLYVSPRSPMVLLDFRAHLMSSGTTPISAAAHKTALETQRKFLRLWAGQGRLVIGPGGISTSAAISSLVRIVRRASEVTNHTDPTPANPPKTTSPSTPTSSTAGPAAIIQQTQGDSESPKFIDGDGLSFIAQSTTLSEIEPLHKNMQATRVDCDGSKVGDRFVSGSSDHTVCGRRRSFTTNDIYDDGPSCHDESALKDSDSIHGMIASIISREVSPDRGE